MGMVYGKPAAATEPEIDGGDVAVAILRDWNSNPEIRAEFGTLSRYAAFKQAKDSGRVKIIGGTVVSRV